MVPLCRCGPWFGKICCCILAVDLLLLHLLAWLRPASDIDIAPDCISGGKAVVQTSDLPTSVQGLQQNGAAEDVIRADSGQKNTEEAWCSSVSR